MQEERAERGLAQRGGQGCPAPSAAGRERLAAPYCARSEVKPFYEFKPAVTEPVVPDRHPWHGLVGKPTFTEISAGIGVFASCFQAAGAKCVCMVEPVPAALHFAKKNCRDTGDVPFGLEDKEPGDFQWTHGIVGGPECQPFSSAGLQRGWEDDRSYTMIRTLHLTAEMKPWWVWLENVSAIESVAGGKVWQTIKGTAEELGYKVKLQQV